MQLLGFLSGRLSNQGEKSINFYFIRVPLRKKVLKYGTPKPSYKGSASRVRKGFGAQGFRFGVWAPRSREPNTP